MNESYIKKLQNTDHYALTSSEDIQEAFINGNALELFNVVFNSISNNIKYLENPFNLIKMYDKYPDDKIVFLEHVLSNSPRYIWNNPLEENKYIISPEAFNNFWGFDITPDTPKIFSIIPRLEDKSKEFFFSYTTNYDSPFSYCLHENQYASKPFFKKYKMHSINLEKQEEQQFDVLLSDHILINLIKNKQYSLLNSYFINIYYDIYDKNIKSYLSYDIIENLAIVNPKNSKTNDNKDNYCANLGDVFFALSIQEPLLLESYKLQTYHDMSYSYSQWASTFVEKNPKPNKENMIVFNKFCDFCSNDIHANDSDLYIKIIVELLRSESFEYANKFIKSTKSITLNKYMTLNLDNNIWDSLLENTQNDSLKQKLLKLDSNFLFHISLSPYPHSTNCFLVKAYSDYRDKLNKKNKEQYELALSKSEYYQYEEQMPMNIEFLKNYMGFEEDVDSIYKLLFSKPLLTEVSSLGYVSNMHYLLNIPFRHSFCTFINDIVLTKHPELNTFNIQDSNIEQKIQHLKLLENLLCSSVFLPTTEHSEKYYKNKISSIHTDKEQEHNSVEQMINIFHIENGNFFKKTSDNNKQGDGDSLIFAELIPNYLFLINNLLTYDFENKDKILSKLSPNILNFFENSMNGFSIYQNYSNNHYSSEKDNNFKFMRDCLSFIANSGLYTKDEILKCINKIQDTSAYRYFQGEYDIANQHFVYINENSMNEVNLKMTCFYIEIEQIFLELNTKNNKIFSNKLKF